jgi:hypothetical protein
MARLAFYVDAALALFLIESLSTPRSARLRELPRDIALPIA